MSAWSLLHEPDVLTVTLDRAECSPTDSSEDESRSFGDVLSPDTFSAQTHLTSELLRFL